MEHKEYNGWTNYETWVTALWMDNEEGMREYYHEFSNAREIEDSITEQWDDIVERATPWGLFSDLLVSSLGEVNWQEIYDNLHCEDEED